MAEKEKKHKNTELDEKEISVKMIEDSEKEKEQAQRLFDALDENDAVNEIYSNLKN